MVLGPNGVVWTDGVQAEEEDVFSWARNADAPPTAAEEVGPETKQDDIAMSLSFGSMLDTDAATTLYFNSQQPPPDLHSLAFLDDSSACSPIQPSFLGIDLAPEAFLPTFNPPNILPTHNSNPDATAVTPPELSPGLLGFFDGFEGPSSLNPPMFFNRPKALRPLEVSPQTAAQPTLFQKRAARHGLSGGIDSGEFDKKKQVEEDVGDDMVSVLNYESDEGNDQIVSGACGKIAVGSGDSTRKNETLKESNDALTVGGDQKGKKKGSPAKNLMAERRRRKKLNDRLYMLRSVVPKISKVEESVLLKKNASFFIILFLQSVY